MSQPTDTAAKVAPKPELVTLTIDDVPVSVPKGTLIIRAAEMIGTAIPRFCDHPLLDPVGACRQCLVEIPDAGNGRGFPKLQTSCTVPVAEGMVVRTQVSSPVVKRAQEGILELLLINHPLDCPICDKGGECPLQNQSLSHGCGESRYGGVKRTYPKPINISAQILLDRERCVLCARCTRFSEQISGDPFIALVERGALQQVGFYEDEPYDSYFSGNVVQICPVGALTSAAYRFQARPFDLKSTTTSCDHCAGGCEIRADHRHHQVKRHQAGDDPEVNEEWLCDKGRFGFVSGRGEDRLTRPLVRQNGILQVASWPEAIDAAVAGLKAAGSAVGVLPGGRLTVENAYAYSRFARTVLGTNNIDFRSRAASEEEAEFLASRVAGRGMDVTYSDLEAAKHVVLVSYEPEDETSVVFLRLRKAVRKNGLKVTTLAPFASRGTQKLSATLIPVAPGAEAQTLEAMELEEGTIILVGERAACQPGLLSEISSKAIRSGARLAWMPRRAGDMGAIAAGCLPGLLPGGRPISSAKARVDMAAAWGVDTLPTDPGLSAAEQFASAQEGHLKAFLVAGVDPYDMPEADSALHALRKSFVVHISTRANAVTDVADVVFPACLIEEQAGHFLNWEQRIRPVALVNEGTKHPMSDLRILSALADAMGSDLGFRTSAAAWADFQELGPWEGERVAVPREFDAGVTQGGVVVASWREALDATSGIDFEVALRRTARPAVARMSPATAAAFGIGEMCLIEAPGSSQLLPVQLTEMVDGVVWVPMNPGEPGRLGVVPGSIVTLTPASSDEGDQA